ncbi:uncharacterized protein LOC132034742 [Lycium ferocissimum]|uniref:uncharacterized protein LOC132034742 n=1 Tax=Lycium ferocissimum TaxID=112874 RepID=UPI002815AB2E|nr:uncharacterized protein LOC132034742 [Lycium ferocissimum]
MSMEILCMSFTRSLRILAKLSKTWSRQAFRDIYEEPKRLEAQMRRLEDNSITCNTEENRMELSRCRAQFTRYLKIQDSMLRQKARVKWLEEGDANTAYFHSIIKDRRRILSIRKIMDENEQWLEDKDNIAEGTVRYYQNIFKQDSDNNNFVALNCLQRCIIEEDNIMLSANPSLQEIKDCVTSLDPDSAPGLDGLSGIFHQKAWNIISKDPYNAIIAFFIGATFLNFTPILAWSLFPK